jgi:hypothetical protein
MKRFGPLTALNNTLPNALTCPAGHKYEVIDLWLGGAGGVGGNWGWFFQPASGGSVFLEIMVGDPAAFYTRHVGYNGVVLLPGEGLLCTVFQVDGSPFTYMGTYIDIDFGP